MAHHGPVAGAESKEKPRKAPKRSAVGLPKGSPQIGVLKPYGFIPSLVKISEEMNRLGVGYVVKGLCG